MDWGGGGGRGGGFHSFTSQIIVDVLMLLMTILLWFQRFFVCLEQLKDVVKGRVLLVIVWQHKVICCVAYVNKKGVFSVTLKRYLITVFC